MKAAFLALMLASGAAAQTPDSLAGQIVVFSQDGHQVTLGDIVNAAAQADVVFLGEIHDDSLGHVVQSHLLRALHERYGRQRPLLLGLEMFETDVQGVLDEYEAGLIRERDFLAASRPWGNYDPDYRRQVEFAIENAIPVVGTNAPKRYVSRVSREGSLDAGLTGIPDAGRATMPAEIVPPSEPLAEKFRGLMGDMGGHGSMPGMPTVDGMLAAQNLRDATMAWALHRAMDGLPEPLAIHLNGSFHSDGGLGIPEHLARIAPEARVLIVSARPASGETPDFTAGDFVILTRATP
ncbi:MAG: ChaN family lipoprotein [Bacteroidota bacterium]